MTHQAISIEPRKLPRQVRAQATVDAILDATARILEREGLPSLNTNHIAETAGISVGSLYQYFPTKNAILTVIIRRKRQELLDELAEALGDMETENLDTTLDKLVEATIESKMNWPKLARTLEYADAFLPLAQETDDLKFQLVNRIAEFLEHHKIEGPRIVAQDIVAIVKGIIETASLAGQTDRASLKKRILRGVNGYLQLVG